MGKHKHEGKGRNISIGGGQERKDLFKDMSGGYNAMGDSNSPNYQYNGSAFKQRFSSPMEKQGPLHGNAFGHAMQKTGGDYDKAKSMLEMKGSPVHKSPYKVIGDPNKKMDRLSAKHKSLYDRFEMGQTSEKEEQRMFRLEDRMDKVGKKIKSKKSPLNKDKKKVQTLGEMETQQNKEANEAKGKMGYTFPNKKTKLQGDYQKRTSDPDYKKPKAKTLKKSPLNQGVKKSGGSKTKYTKEIEKNNRADSDDVIKFKKQLIEQSKQKMLQTGRRKTTSTKKTMTTGRGKTTSTKKTMTTGRGKTTKSPLNQGFDADAMFKTLPGGNYPKPPISGRNPNYKPGVKADEDRTKKDKRKHKRTMKKLGRLTKKIVLKSTSKK